MNGAFGAMWAYWPYGAVAAGLIAFRLAMRRAGRGPGVPIGWFLAYALGRPAARWLAHPSLFPGLGAWADTVSEIVLACAVLRLAVFLAAELPARRRGRPMARITRDFLLGILFALAALIVLRVRGNVHLAGILTTSAVLTAVIGLAMQATLSNFFAGLAIQLERPFALGDWIAVGEHEGKVIGITWKSTRLLNRERQMVYLPNAMVTSGPIRVFTRPEPGYIVKFDIGVEYDAPPDRVSRTIREAIRGHPDIPGTPSPEIRLKSFGDFSITYEIRFVLTAPERERRVVADVNRILWYALRREGIRIPFPVRDVRHAHVERARAERKREDTGREIETVLARLDILSALDGPERARLAREAPCVRYAAGEDIVRKDDPGDSLFVILEGRCVVERRTPGDERPAPELAPGDCFGEMSLLTGEPRSATVRATTETLVLRVGKTCFAGILGRHPDLAARLADIMTRRLPAPGAAPQSAGEIRDRSLLNRIRRFFGL